MTDENVLYVQDGRHALQELCVEQFIANSMSIAATREGAIKIVTGPNYSGIHCAVLFVLDAEWG